MPTLHFAQRHAAAGGQAWFYRFDAAVPILGATHAAELSYLWGWSGLEALILRGRPTRGRRELGRRMRDHCTAFVRDGSPRPSWPAFELPDRASTVFTPTGDRVEPDPDRSRPRWRDVDVMPRA